MIFGIKKIDNFVPYNVLLAIATKRPVLPMTGFVLQAHKWNQKIRFHVVCAVHTVMKLNDLSHIWAKKNQIFLQYERSLCGLLHNHISLYDEWMN